MRWRLFSISTVFLTVGGSALANATGDPRDAFFGVWGTSAQCSGEPIIDGGTVRAAPYVIDADWLKHGQVWCRLNWFPVETRENGAFSGASAQCGEDSVRGYRINMELEGGQLTLRWDFPQVGPLMRCETP